MFLLYGPRPYVSIVCPSAICFYCMTLGHMFLLCGARPYVSIVCVDHMFLLCGCGPYVMSHTPKPYAAPYVFIGKELVGAIEVVQTSECSIILCLNVYIHYFSIYKCEMFRCAASLVGSVPLGPNST